MSECVRSHPYSVRRKACRLYAERYPLTEVSKILKIPVTTLYNWSRDNDFKSLRDEVELDLRGDLQSMRNTVVTALNRTLRVYEKLAARIEEHLDKGELIPEELAVLALAFERNSNVLLRLLGK